MSHCRPQLHAHVEACWKAGYAAGHEAALQELAAEQAKRDRQIAQDLTKQLAKREDA